MDYSLHCVKLPTYAPKDMNSVVFMKDTCCHRSFYYQKGIKRHCGNSQNSLVECTVYLQCRFLVVIIISHKVLACSEVLIVFTCSCDCTFNTCVYFLIWSVWKDRTDTQVLFFPSFRKCNVLCNFATSEMKLIPVCI